MHRTTPQFWRYFEELPPPVQRVARQNFNLLQANPRHPSLRFAKVGTLWSARVGEGCRALAVEARGHFTWFWIGGHDEYIRRVRQS